MIREIAFQLRRWSRLNSRDTISEVVSEGHSTVAGLAAQRLSARAHSKALAPAGRSEITSATDWNRQRTIISALKCPAFKANEIVKYGRNYTRHISLQIIFYETAFRPLRMTPEVRNRAYDRQAYTQSYE